MKARSILWLGLDRWLDRPWRRWLARAAFWLLFLLVVFPYYLSRVITTPPDVSWSRAAPADFNLPFESFTVRSFDGVVISAWYFPAPDTQARPTVVFAHGLGDSKAGVLVNARFLHERGFSCCLLDLRNHGDSGRRLVTLGAHEARDIEAVLEWLRREKGARRFVIWGVSLGAASSLLAATDEPDVDGLILEACYESMKKTSERHRRIFFPWIPRWPFLPLTFKWFEWRTGVHPDEIDLVRAASELKQGKMLLIAGEKDIRAPASASQEILDAATVPCELWVMPGIDHDNLGGDPDYESKIEAFLKSLESSKLAPVKVKE